MSERHRIEIEFDAWDAGDADLLLLEVNGCAELRQRAGWITNVEVSMTPVVDLPSP